MNERGTTLNTGAAITKFLRKIKNEAGNLRRTVLGHALESVPEYGLHSKATVSNTTFCVYFFSYNKSISLDNIKPDSHCISVTLIMIFQEFFVLFIG